MTRNLSLISSRRPTLRGADTSAGSHGANATRANSDVFPLPSGSLPNSTGATIERSNISDTARDVIALGLVFLFVASVSLAFLASLFILFFVQT